MSRFFERDVHSSSYTSLDSNADPEPKVEADDDHICSFYKATKTFKVECENCIEQVVDMETGKTYDCRCYQKHIVKQTCMKCEVLKECMELCQEQIDKILLDQGQKIKTTCLCDESEFNKIPELVRKMRYCKRVLLQKM